MKATATVGIACSSALAAAETPKYSAKVPSEIITPNHVTSEYLGEMNYIDGAPTEETYSKTRDFVESAARST